jgi:thiol-disulfide isomerase/thioredoxin
VLRKIDTHWLILFAGLCIGGLLGFFSSIFWQENGAVNGLRSLRFSEISNGSYAENFALKTVAGETIQLSDLKGRPLVLNFWATWCGPCQVEMPLIQEFYERFSPDLEVLAINYDESIGEIQPFVNDLGLTFPVLLDPGGEIADLYQVRGFPTTYFIDREGFVRGLFIGILSEKVLKDHLKKIGVGE